MGHKGDRSFFDEKKPWSKRKDQILAYYLTPYLAKIATVGRPIVLVDAFAGPGPFKSGDHGSPLIIANAIESFMATHPDATCRGVCIERDADLHEQLAANVREFKFIRTQRSTFLEFLPEIEGFAAHSSVFIYADPFAIDGLEWAAMDQVFQSIGARRSVELLLNFNAGAFVRRARAALQYAVAREDPGDDEDASSDVAATTLDRVVGGRWWQELVSPGGWFAGEVEAIAERLRQQLRKRFGEAGLYDVRARLTDKVPKYYLMYASRHSDGLCLINEAVCKDRESEVRSAGPTQRLLFEPSPEEMPSIKRLLRPALLELLNDGMQRRDLQVAVTRRHFGLFREKTVRHEIGRLRSDGLLRAEPDKPRLNDRSRLFHPSS